MPTYTVTTSFSADTTAIASEVNRNFTDVLTALNALDAGNLSTGTLPLGRISGLTTTQFAAATLVIESEGLASSDNDTSLPTTAAVRDYVDTQDTAQFASGGVIENIFGSWTNQDSAAGTLAKAEVYKVGSDGVVIAIPAVANAVLTGLTDGGNPPTTVRSNAEHAGGVTRSNINLYVRKDDYWKVTATAGTPAIYWLPIGTGTSVKQ